jgi:hypothetical protein
MRERWTPEEDQILSDHYGRSPFRVIHALLPRRTRDAVKGRAHQLGLTGDQASVLPLAVKRYAIDERFFSRPTLENSYWAGFIAADGCISPRQNSVKIMVSERDSDHLRRFAESAGYDGPIRIHGAGSYKPQSKAATLNICGVPGWIADLEQIFNITARKPLTLAPPPKIPDRDCALAFIVGYLDGDGSIHVSSHRYKDRTYHSIVISFRGTGEFLRWIKAYFDRLVPPRRGEASVTESGRHPEYKVGGSRAEAILRVLASLDVPRLARKWVQLEG